MSNSHHEEQASLLERSYLPRVAQRRRLAVLALPPQLSQLRSVPRSNRALSGPHQRHASLSCRSTRRAGRLVRARDP